MGRIEVIEAAALRSLLPPPRLRLSDWIEGNITLPEGVSAQPGAVRLWPFQREIADAIGDPAIERVTLVKPVRVGFTTLLTSAVASFVANDPAPILSLLPAEADCRDYVVSDLEPIFGASPALASALSDDADGTERNTLLSRRFPGGSLKVVAARSPRNLRRHNARILFIDEADAMEATPEGSPVLLAERRTLSFPDRKIVLGSTPVHEATSHVLRAYAQSDARVFEVLCPECGEFAEIRWEAITWPTGRGSLDLSGLRQRGPGGTQAGDGRGRALARDPARGRGACRVPAERPREPAHKRQLGTARGRVPRGEGRPDNPSDLRQHDSGRGVEG